MNTQTNALASRPSIIVIFGISGDLAKRKVLPALYHLLKDNLLPDDTLIVGTSRRGLSKDELLKDVELCVLEEDKVCDPAVIKRFRAILNIIKFDPIEDASYELLKSKLENYESDHGECFNRIFYLSIPPQVVGPIVRRLGESGLSKSCSHGVGQSRLLIEKPFGYNLNSAKDLIKETSRYFKESQLFRIDHYLAKESAQNILTFRKYNPLFSTIWDHKSIAGIHIRALELIGIEGRANFYDNTGALRDIVQSHLMQLLALTTMELPNDINDSSQIHKAKFNLFKDIEPVTYKSDLVRGQYASYRKEVDNLGSITETYVKLKLNIKNKRWAKVPIYLETGKHLSSKTTDITITFKERQKDNANQLTMRLQPNEGIDIKLIVKKPGLDNTTQVADMDFSYKRTFDDNGHPDAYERVLVDAIKGDQALFASGDEVIRSWQILEPILIRWQSTNDDLVIYPNGSETPIS